MAFAFPAIAALVTFIGLILIKNAFMSRSSRTAAQKSAAVLKGKATKVVRGAKRFAALCRAPRVGDPIRFQFAGHPAEGRIHQLSLRRVWINGIERPHPNGMMPHPVRCIVRSASSLSRL